MKTDKRVHKVVSTVILVIVVGIVAMLWYLSSVEDNITRTDVPEITDTSETEVTDFASCVEAGNPVMESYPEQCSANGVTYVNPEQRRESEAQAQPSTGIISGEAGYPSERLPEDLEICLESVETNEIVGECHEVNVADYSIEAPEGTFYVFARTQDRPDYRAYYNEFVECGLRADCPKSGHQALIGVEVTSGGTVEGVNPNDWYDTSQ
ncbi:MAG: hypothetical protein U5L95_03440 [Candidatus Saccharibacteria bacterium]|nr:hypothetical protein [Candidatus Saccharibacteria bacterium]